MSQSDKSLEFFFGEVPQFVTLSVRYPHLTKLTIVGQGSLTTLRGLETLPELRELWVVECCLRQINHLENAEKLEKLFLYSNRIEVMDGLSRCGALVSLWLDNNQLGAVAGLRYLPHLKHLNLAQNNIAHIGDVDWGDSVEWLNLSGNPLPLTDLPALTRLPRLSALHLQDCMYRPAPCTRLCNVRLFCVLLLPRLEQLDCQPLSDHERLVSRQRLASRLVYYRAVCRHVQARCQQQLTDLGRDWAEFLAAMSRRLRQLQAKSRQVEEAAASADDGGAAASEETLAAFGQAIGRRQECVVSVVRGQASHGYQRRRMLVKRRQLVQALLELEYRTVGNIRCEEINVGDGAAGGRVPALGRYLGRDKVALSAGRSVRLLAMYKVNNRFLENTMVQRSAAERRARLLDRFLTANAENDIDWILELCKGNISTRLSVSSDLNVPDETSALKVLTARSYFGCFHEAVLVQILALPPGKTVPAKVPDSLDVNSEELLKRRLIVAPKFILLYTIGDSYNDKPMACLSNASLDDDLLKSVCLPTAEVLEVAATPLGDAGGATLKPTDGRLSAAGRHITCVQNLENAAEIEQLDLSSNQLRSVAFLRNLLTLKTLNISFNNIQNISGLPKLPCLESLDISWNRLDKLPATLRRLAVACPRLKTLDIRFNPWLVAEELQGRLVALLLPGLQELRGQTLCQPDSAGPTFRRLECPLEIGDLSLPQAAPRPDSTARLDPRRLTAVCLDGQLLQSLQCIADIPFLQKLSLNGNLLRTLDGLEAFPHLEYVSVDFNDLSSLHGLPECSAKLRSLSARHNTLDDLSGLATTALPLLELLDVSGNPVTSLAGLQRLPSLVELYVTAARLSELSSLSVLTACSRLQALDAYDNPVSGDPNYRAFVLYKATGLHILDGGCVSADERAEAVSMLSGLLTLSRLQDSLAPHSLTSLTQLDLPAVNIRQVDLPADCLQHVTSISLEDNELTVLSGLQHLRQLRVLNLTNNSVRRLRERSQQPPPAGAVCFPALKVLILASNGLVQLAPLCLPELRSLTSLFLHDNQIKAIDSVSRCAALQLLVVDRNQLQSLPSDALVSLSSLRALHAEGNRLRRLPTLWPPQLRALYLANNKLSEPLELTRLGGKLELRRVTLYKNPLTRHAKWQAIVCASQPTLQVLDGSPVADVFASRAGLDGDGDGDSADEDALRGRGSVWWRPLKSTVTSHHQSL